MSYQCARCKEKGGKSLPRCFWADHSPKKNWNCGTIARLRDAIDAAPPEVMHRRIWGQSYALIPLPTMDGALYLGWYKDRGTTEQAVFLPEDGVAHDLLESEANEVLAIMGLA